MMIVIRMMQYLVFDGTFAWHTHDVNTRDDKMQYINELSLFKLFFTHELIDMICLYTYRYAPAISHHKPLAIQKLDCVAKNEMYVISVTSSLGLCGCC